jgi:sterol 3beta-glucosyltransferase
MNITILTYGSRGDVQPFLPLACGLVDKGHQVIFAAPARFEALVRGHGIPFSSLDGEPEDLSRRLNDSGYNFIKMAREMMDHAVEIGAQVFRQIEDASKDADLIIHTFVHAVGAHTLAREKNIPDIHLQNFPLFAITGDYPNVSMPHMNNRFLNRITHAFAAKVSWWGSIMGFEQVRRRAGLPKRKLFWPFTDSPGRSRTPILCAWSPEVVPPSGDWPPRVHMTGYYFLSPGDSYQPPAELSSFLEAGKPPVCISFGSMINKRARQINEIVHEALHKTGNRGVILSGWAGVESLASADLLYLEAAPHDWLFPRCSMVIHHGGAGTTAAGLRAGVPTVVVPFTADQPFWGRRVHAIGVGPKPIRVNILSVEGLARAMTEADAPVVRERARQIGRKIHSEDGVSVAIQLIERYVSEFKARSASVIRDGP